MGRKKNSTWRPQYRNHREHQCAGVPETRTQCVAVVLEVGYFVLNRKGKRLRVRVRRRSESSLSLSDSWRREMIPIVRLQRRSTRARLFAIPDKIFRYLTRRLKLRRDFSGEAIS